MYSSLYPLFFRDTMVNNQSFLRRLIPPPGWRLVATILTGVIFGLAIGTFYISNAASYLSDDPEACVNCHVMVPQFATWNHSSHREWTTCNDCHVPHDNAFRKYLFKAQDGMRHAYVFTTGTEPQVIRIKEAGKAVVQDNCMRCHYNQVNPVSAANVTGHNYQYGEGKLCWDCHREVPHGRISSQASTPYARVPSMKRAVPEWLEKMLD